MRHKVIFFDETFIKHQQFSKTFFYIFYLPLMIPSHRPPFLQTLRRIQTFLTALGFRVRIAHCSTRSDFAHF